jgi:hypothetical protein
MKKALVLALCVFGFILIAAPTAVEYAPLFINGKPAGRAVFVNGVTAISVENAATDVGSKVTLQPFLQRQGPRLLAMLDASGLKQTPAPATPGALKQSGQGEWKFFTPAPGQILRVQRAGEISSKVFEFEGKAYFPLADFAHAIGMNTYTGGVFKPNEPIRLSSSPTGILIGL